MFNLFRKGQLKLPEYRRLVCKCGSKYFIPRYTLWLCETGGYLIDSAEVVCVSCGAVYDCDGNKVSS